MRIPITNIAPKGPLKAPVAVIVAASILDPVCSAPNAKMILTRPKKAALKYKQRR